MSKSKLTKAELEADNEALQAAVTRLAEELSRATAAPPPWTLQVGDHYLKAQLPFEDAKAWGRVLNCGQFRQANPGAPIAIVTA
jgi:hypothetical protein